VSSAEIGQHPEHGFFQPVIDLAGRVGKTAFYLVLASMVFVPAAMYLWMRCSARM
jgi:hypothetical protein